jgi:hypothetical protein
MPLRSRAREHAWRACSRVDNKQRTLNSRVLCKHNHASAVRDGTRKYDWTYGMQQPLLEPWPMQLSFITFQIASAILVSPMSLAWSPSE